MLHQESGPAGQPDIDLGHNEICVIRGKHNVAGKHQREARTDRRAIVVEDATPGILSARAAGTRVIGVRAGNFVGYDLSPADAVVDTLDDVTDELLARLCP